MTNRPHNNIPSIWVLTDDRPGNTTQSVGLADALGWSYQLKPLQFNVFSRLHNRVLGTSNIGLTKISVNTLQPPWPNIVIAAGRRTAPVAKWIKKKSHGHTRLVHLGRKGSDVAEHFDAVITPTYCRLPSHPRRIETVGPLTKMTQPKLLDAAKQWPNLLGNSPHPQIVLLVGGATHRHHWHADIAFQLGQEVRSFVRKQGGTVFAVTSRRTGSEATESLKKGLGEEVVVDAWQLDRRDNPYLAYLALADALIVTGDSESMLAEAVATNHPVSIYFLPEKTPTLHMRLGEWMTTQFEQNGRWTWLMRKGFIRPPRDLHRFYHMLIQSGHAQPFGASLEIKTRQPLIEAPLVAEKVRKQLGFAGTL